MNLIELLNKYSMKPKINKTEFYEMINQDKGLLEKEGFKFECKQGLDLYSWEIILKGLKQKKIIDDTYYNFYAKNYDVLNYISYEDRRKMFLQDESEKLNDLIYFVDKFSQTNIYIPCYEPFINVAYIMDYEVLQLENHVQYLSKFVKSIKKMTELYGSQVYLSEFCSLEIVGKDQDNYYFYSKVLNNVLIVGIETGRFQGEINLVDRFQDSLPTKEVIKEGIIKLLSTTDDQEVLDYLYEQKILSDKGYQKIRRKLK